MMTAWAYVMNSADAPGFWQLGNLWRVAVCGSRAEARDHFERLPGLIFVRFPPRVLVMPRVLSISASQIAKAQRVWPSRTLAQSHRVAGDG